MRDRGAGIAEDEIARLFQPFHRAASSRDDVPGTGIDLYVVRRIVEAHGGRIAVHSPIGAGSEFVVRLPLEATAPRDVLDTAIDGPSGPGAG